MRDDFAAELPRWRYGPPKEIARGSSFCMYGGEGCRRPNKGIQPTSYSLRSFLASASRRG